MGTLRTSAAFIVYSNLFIATCAALLCVETMVLLRLPGTIYWYTMLAGSATLFIYALHYQVKTSRPVTDQRLHWCRSHPRVLPLMLILSAGLSGYLILTHFDSLFHRQSLPHFGLLLLIPVLSFGYSHPVFFKKLRSIGWLKPLVLTYTWTAATVWAPVILAGTVPDWQPDNKALLFLFLHRFFFIAALVVLFNLYDLEEDSRDGIRTPVMQIGKERVLHSGKWLFFFLYLLTAASFVVNAGPLQPYAIAALFIPAGLLLFLFQRFNPQEEELFFILKYDGLMLVKSLLLIFATSL